MMNTQQKTAHSGDNIAVKSKRLGQHGLLRVGAAVAVGTAVMGMTALSASAQRVPVKKAAPKTTLKKVVPVTPAAKQKPMILAPVQPMIMATAFDFNKILMDAPTVDAWFAGLSDWTKARAKQPNSEKKTNAGGGTEKHDGRNYTVTRTKHSITETPEEIVTFQPVNGFWLGGLVQEKGLQQGLGSMQEISVPATKRAAFKISSDLPIANNYRSVSAPSATTVSSAIGGLLSTKVSGGGARTLSIVDNYNEEQTAHDLGLSASYMTANLKTAFKSDRFNSKHTITAAFIERAATLQADFEGRSRREAFFKSNFTVDDAKALTTQGRATNHNLPAYIKSITYGRVVIFNLTSTLTESEMRAALNASANTGAFSVNANYNGTDRLKNTSFELRVTTLGGGQQSFGKLVPATGISNVLQVMNTYLKQPAPLSTMVPISYTANTMRDDQLAALSRTTDYTVTKYVANPIGERYKIKMWATVLKSDDGAFDNTLECHGILRVNGDVWWEIPRSAAGSNQREKNQVLEISENAAYNKGKDFTFDYYYDTKTKFNLDLVLTDHDSGSKDDVFGKFNKVLDLRSMSGKTQTWDWDSGDGEASRLHMRVERVDYL